MIRAYRQTRQILARRREDLIGQRGNCERRILVLEAEIDEVDEVLRMLAKYDDESTATGRRAG
ncbi:MAG: hypothetical protein ACOYJY_00185 [Acutalibacteraceae bacterium]